MKLWFNEIYTIIYKILKQDDILSDNVFADDVHAWKNNIYFSILYCVYKLYQKI